MPADMQTKTKKQKDGRRNGCNNKKLNLQGLIIKHKGLLKRHHTQKKGEMETSNPIKI